MKEKGAGGCPKEKVMCKKCKGEKKNNKKNKNKKNKKPESKKEKKGNWNIIIVGTNNDIFSINLPQNG